jgi:hypothetical protein
LLLFTVLFGFFFCVPLVVLAVAFSVTVSLRRLFVILQTHLLALRGGLIERERYGHLVVHLIINLVLFMAADLFRLRLIHWLATQVVIL